MRRVILIVLFLVTLLWPNIIFAADFKFNINICRSEDGTSSEIWYNEQVVWRLRIVSDTRPVISSSDKGTILIMPYIENGMLVLKIYNN